jgi:hypothetical protein
MQEGEKLWIRRGEAGVLLDPGVHILVDGGTMEG